MARGIGGEDGPSIFMFVACVLIWGKVAGWFEKAQNGVISGLELGQNSAGPLQAETTVEISTMEAEVKSWPVAWSQLPKPKTYYQNIANQLWDESKSKLNIDEARMIALCRPLSKNELMAVAKCFGVRESSMLGLTTWTGHIFKAFDLVFDGMFKKDDLAQMKKIWSVTRLW